MSGCPNTDVAAYENCGAPAQGLAAFGVDPNVSAIKAAVASSTPRGVNASYPIVCEAMLRAGGLIYFKSSPGDCGAPPTLPGITSGQIAGLSGAAASGVTGILGTVGVIGGAATLGISTAITAAVGGIETIFAHHAQAVANEQATICSVANFFNSAKRAIDSAVRSGMISPDEGVAYLTQVANQAKSGLATIMNTCNAACYYQGFLQAFINYARTWYDYLAPALIVFPQAPNSPPSSYGTPPGGVTQTGSLPAPPPPIRSTPGNVYAPAGPAPYGPLSPPLNTNTALPGNYAASDYLNQGYNQPTGDSAQAADTPPSQINWQTFAAIATVVLVAFTLLGSRKAAAA